MMRTSALLLALSLLLVAADGARGETLVVNSKQDLADADLLDGVCDADLDTPGLQITLRAAVQHANVTPGADRIELPSGTYKLKIKGSGEDAAATGDLDVLDELEIVSIGPKSAKIDGKKAKDRVFDVLPGGALELNGVTVLRGKVPALETGGGGIHSAGELRMLFSTVKKCRSHDDAAGIYVAGGSAELIAVLVQANRAKDDGGGMDVDGGEVSVSFSAFVKNRAGDEGGGLENSGAAMEIVNSTFSGNRAKNEGGGLVNEDGGELTMINVTVARNKAPQGAGISIDDDGGLNTTAVRNVVFANKKKRECHGTLFSLGGNLDLGNTCGFGPGNLSDTNPRLKKLKMNGGFTPTHALKASSPCIDAGVDDQAPVNDQRFYGRVDVPDVGRSTVDIGAFEFDGVEQPPI